MFYCFFSVNVKHFTPDKRNYLKRKRKRDVTVAIACLGKSGSSKLVRAAAVMLFVRLGSLTDMDVPLRVLLILAGLTGQSQGNSICLLSQAYWKGVLE